ncbi:hypothetical protein ACEPAI_7642 [Sanghuangporus weigelae]
MPTLLDHIDRFTYTAQSIQTAARNTSEPLPSPYIRAVLRTPLGDLARDVDTSELGLFTLVPNASAPSASGDESGASAAQKGSIARVEFPGATPLRRPAGASKHPRREIDKEPEVYAQAALKYLDRYHSIRPMPKARQEVEAIIEHLKLVRNEIEQLSEVADQSAGPASQPVTTLRDEEKRIQELHVRIKQMKARIEVLERKQKPYIKPSASSAKDTVKDKEEDAFWAEPATTRKPRTGRKSLLIPTLARGTVGPDDSLLLDTHVKVDMGAMLGDMSMTSLADAAPTPASKVDPVSVPLPSRSPTPSQAPSPTPAAPLYAGPADSGLAGPAETSADLTTDEGDDTVILAKPPSLTPAVPSTPPQALSAPSETPAPATPAPNVAATPRPGVTATPGTARLGRVKITTDVERIATKIWATVGDVIMPGHPFSTAAAATTNKPPRAKETIALLQNLASQKPPPTSPTISHSTFSIITDKSSPGTHAILTAHLLLALINAIPRHAMPLAATKVVLAEANKSLGNGAPPDPAEASLGLLAGGDKAMETRALYGCVAKRLLKIDRSGREQLVRFDI